MMKIISVFCYIILSISLMSGCSNNEKLQQYYKNAKMFNKLYFEIVEDVDIKNHTRSIELLQSESNDKKIAELGNLLRLIETDISKEKEVLLPNFKKRYDDLVLLSEIDLKRDYISNEERLKINTIFISIGLDKVDWKDKKSNTVWE